MNNDPLLQPLTIKKVTFRNRVMSTSHACGLEEEGGMPAEKYQRYHVEKARGGLGLTMFGGSSYIDHDSTWRSGQLNIGTDRIIPYLQSFSDRVRGEGAGIMMQITHLGRRGESQANSWLPTIAPSPIRELGHRSFPREMNEYDIQRVITAFGQAALRCKEGGLDGLETMVAGHLIGQFLSPVTNKRTDLYGGNVENRCRFGLMVHDEIRRQVGDDFIVGMRIPIDETIAEGLGYDDCLAIAGIFERSGLVDYFNVNYGRIDTEVSLVTDCMPGMQSPIAPWLEKAGAFKREVGLPVFHAARITDLSNARYAIREGLLDMVAMTRAHIADPNIVNKIIAGEEQRIRPCVGAMHCMGDNRPTCLHNPPSGREQFWPHVIKRSERDLKVVVIGGGPAGLEAARVAAERGHRVVLLEATNQLGGQICLAKKAKWRRDLAAIVDWRAQELKNLEVEVRLDCFAEASDVTSESPDVVVMATGGQPDLQWLDGGDLCVSTWDILSGNCKPDKNCIVYDGTGRSAALVAVDVLYQSGILPALYLVDDRPGAELAYGERIIWKRELSNMEVDIQREYQLVRVIQDGSRLQAHFKHALTGKACCITTDQVIIEHGTLPMNDLFEELSELSCNSGMTDIHALAGGLPQPLQPAGNGGDFILHRVGDALTSRDIAAATFDSLRLCCVL